jgi:polysaccharide export outer membrane protein
MSMKNHKSGRNQCYPATLGVLLFALFSPGAGVAQQGVAVSPNVLESANLPARHPQAPIPAGISAAPEGFENLRLSPGDLLQMDIFGVSDMSAQLRIDAQGNVSIPLIGSLHIEGNTLLQAQNALAKALADAEILRNPQVVLNLLQFSARNISVMGEVQSPGRIQLLAPASLGTVLALAGGETIAAGNDIEIQHYAANGKADTRRVTYLQGKDPGNLQSVLVEPGDTVLVHRAGIIYVLGAVNRPGGYLMVNGGTLNVVQAISLAGGESLQSSTRWAIIVRRQEDGFTQIKIPLGKMEKGDVTPVALQLNDALYVPVSGWKSLVTNGSSVLSAAAAASVYAIANMP